MSCKSCVPESCPCQRIEAALAVIEARGWTPAQLEATALLFESFTRGRVSHATPGAPSLRIVR